MFLICWTYKYTVTTKPGLEVTQGHRNRHLSIRHQRPLSGGNRDSDRRSLSLRLFLRSGVVK